MFKVSCILLAAVLCSLCTADLIFDVNGFKGNLLENEGFGINEEIPREVTKTYIDRCYDEQTKLAYKVDATWYPENKCEQRVCSRQRNSKIPTIKTMECEPCLTCDSPDKICHPFRPEKNFPKCCPQCLTKSAILKKTDSSKKYKQP